MKGHSIRCYGTDLSTHRKTQREAQKLNVSATTIYKGGLAFHVPKELHYANGKVRTSVYNLIKQNDVVAMVKLGNQGVSIARVAIGEAV